MLTRPMILFFLFYVAVSAAGTGVTTFSIVAFPLLYHVTASLAGTLLTVFLVAAIFGSLPGGWLADHARRENLILATCFLVMALALIAIGTGGLSLWLIFAAMIVAGLMRGLYNASRDILVRRVAPGVALGRRSPFSPLATRLDSVPPRCYLAGNWITGQPRAFSTSPPSLLSWQS